MGGRQRDLCCVSTHRWPFDYMTAHRCIACSSAWLPVGRCVTPKVSNTLLNDRHSFRSREWDATVSQVLTIASERAAIARPETRAVFKLLKSLVQAPFPLADLAALHTIAASNLR